MKNMDNVQYVVEVYFDIDRPTLILTQEWVRHRLELFHKWTIPSLLNQTNQNFRIWVYCGLRNQEITTNYQGWNPKVEISYNFGRKLVQSVNKDFLALTRIDSDDLMHKDGMAEIMDFKPTGNCDFLIFRKNLFWDKYNGFISYHNRTFPPFATHIFPRSVYENWGKFHEMHHVRHGKTGARAFPEIHELSEHKICVVHHGENIGHIRRGLQPTVVTAEMRGKLLKKGLIMSDRPDVMLEILKPFGVKEL